MKLLLTHDCRRRVDELQCGKGTRSTEGKGKPCRDSIELDEIVWDTSIYPRDKWSTSTIERYVDAKKSGAVFPPVIVEKDTHRLLDGKHRLEMEKRYAAEHAEANGAWEYPVPDGKIAVEIHAIPEGMSAKYYAATLSARHGDRLSNSDLKQLAVEEFEADYSLPIGERRNLEPAVWGRDLGVSKRTMYRWVGHIVNRDKTSRSAVAWRLSKLGWTQKEIGELFGVTERTIREETGRHCQLAQVSDFLGESWNEESVAEVSKRLDLPLTDTWAAAMDGMDDAERMEWLGIKIQPYDVWNFPSCHDLMGDTHPGRIPGELICHVLYFYTKPGDRVVDPMAGSGTTLDACLLMGRKCRGYDIDARHARPDVEHCDISEGCPGSIEKASLIFWDPPYFSKMDSSNVKDGYIDGSISKLDRDEYLQFFADEFSSFYEKAKPKTVLAFLMSDWNDNEGKQEGVFLWDYTDRLTGAGWNLERQLQVPLTTQQVHPNIVNKFRESRKLARLQRYLLIARKP